MFRRRMISSWRNWFDVWLLRGLYMIRKYANLPIDLIIFYIFKDTKLFIFMYWSQGARAIVSNQKVFLELQKEADKVRRIITCWIHFETRYYITIQDVSFFEKMFQIKRGRLMTNTRFVYMVAFFEISA